MTDEELQQVEQLAEELARNAGHLLMDYFSKPLEVSYKEPNRRSPVTDADKASDDYIRREILRRFPDHGILSEEAESDSELRSPVTWIVDPLDGTNNFMNHLPIFGVSIGVVEGDRPVAGAIFIPSIFSAAGTVFHARAGGGTKRDGVPLALDPGQTPGNNLLSALPGSFSRMFNIRQPLRGRIGEARTTGSVAFEAAMVSAGVFQYAVWNGPKIWDVAAALLLVKEAEGSVMIRHTRPRIWQPFDHFDASKTAELPTHGELRAWHAALVVGTKVAAPFVTQGLQHRSYRISRGWRRIRRLFRRPAPPTSEVPSQAAGPLSPSEEVSPSPAPANPEVSTKRQA